MANPERCSGCGGLIALIGIRHRCIEIPKPVKTSTTYRYRDPVKRRAQMRDFMKRKRAKKGAT